MSIMAVKFVQNTLPVLKTTFTKDVVAQSVLSTVLSTLAVKMLGCGHTASTSHLLNREG